MFTVLLAICSDPRSILNLNVEDQMPDVSTAAVLRRFALIRGACAPDLAMLQASSLGRGPRLVGKGRLPMKHNSNLVSCWWLFIHPTSEN